MVMEYKALVEVSLYMYDIKAELATIFIKQIFRLEVKKDIDLSLSM